METYPQIITQVNDNGVTLTTVVDAPFVSVTSVNGRTGDVKIQGWLKINLTDSAWSGVSWEEFTKAVKQGMPIVVSSETDADGYSTYTQEIASQAILQVPTDNMGVSSITLRFASRSVVCYQNGAVEVQE